MNGDQWKCSTPAPTPPVPAPTCLITELPTPQVRPRPQVSPLAALFISDRTDVGLVTCGGQYTLASCIRLSTPGATEWEHYADIGFRAYHTSWWTPSGKLLLLGGRVGSNYLSSTELVGDGTSPFTLQRAAR